jgi:hypothetical protein
MSNNYRGLWLGLAMAVCAPSLAASAQETPDFVGSWRLESWNQADGTPRCSEEEGSVSGQIVYTSDGHMSAQLGCAEIDLGNIDDLSPQDVRRRLSRRHLSYYGAYTLQESAGTVTHHVMGSSNVGMVRTDQVRSFVFEGNDRLVLSPPGGAKLLWLRNR